MIPFDYVRPETLEQLLDGLRRSGAEGAVLAGGTDLHVKMRLGHTAPRVLFDISELAACRQVIEADGWLRIGSCVTMAELIASATLSRVSPSLAAAARAMSCRQIRNRATLGGNIVTASPAADALPPLLAGDATLLLAGPAGRRELPLAEFLTGPGRTALAPGEVLIEIALPAQGSRSRFVKVGRRRAQAISVVTLAGQLELGADGVLRDVRIALGAVAPTVMRARRAELALEGQPPSAENLAAAAALAAEECRPISDVRGTAEGRRLLVQAWTLRLLRQLCAKDGGTSGGAGHDPT